MEVIQVRSGRTIRCSLVDRYIGECDVAISWAVYDDKSARDTIRRHQRSVTWNSCFGKHSLLFNDSVNLVNRSMCEWNVSKRLNVCVWTSARDCENMITTNHCGFQPLSVNQYLYYHIDRSEGEWQMTSSWTVFVYKSTRDYWDTIGATRCDFQGWLQNNLCMIPCANHVDLNERGNLDYCHLAISWIVCD